MVCINFTVVVIQVGCTFSAHLDVEQWNVVPQTALEFFNRQALSSKECISNSSPVTVVAQDELSGCCSVCKADVSVLLCLK